MLTILNLFGHSPFAPLQKHMEAVVNCTSRLLALFEALDKQDYLSVEKIAEEISIWECKADTIKNEIRTHLPKSIFLPIDRNQLLDILSVQDRIADSAEDIAVLATLRPLEILSEFKALFFLFLKKNLETFHEGQKIMQEVHNLIESSFGGLEAKRVKAMIDKVAEMEHEVDLIQRELLKKLFNAENKLTFATFYQWQKIFEAIASLSNLSENLANRVHVTLELE